jgi:Flp pilus assembly protein TadD
MKNSLLGLVLGLCCLLVSACQTAMPARSVTPSVRAPLVTSLGPEQLQLDLEPLGLPPDPEALLKRKPGDPQALRAMVVQNFTKGRWARAMLFTDMLLRQNPRDAFALNLMGLILWQQSRSLEEDRRALTYFLLSAEADPSLTAARLNLGFMNLRLGQVEAAEKEFQRAQILCPPCSVVWVGTALVAFSQGKSEEARRHIQNALSLNSEDKVAKTLHDLWTRSPPDQTIARDLK